MDEPKYENQTEFLLAHARNDADRRLIEYGYNPWQIEDFRRLTADQKLRALKRMSEFVRQGRRSLARRRS